MGCHFHASTTFPLGKPQRFIVSMGQGGPQKGSGRLGGGKNLFPLLRIEIYSSMSASSLLNRPVLFFFRVAISIEGRRKFY